MEDVERFDWPDPDVPSLVEEDALERARNVRERGEYATSVGVGMLFHRSQWMRGFDQWMIDMVLKPDLHKAIADRIHHINLILYIRTNSVQMIQLSCIDIF